MIRLISLYCFNLRDEALVVILCRVIMRMFKTMFGFRMMVYVLC